MVKILVSDNYLDFEAPLYMTEENKKKFISGMKIIFGNRITVEEIIENKKEMGDMDRHPKRFTADEEFILLNSNFSNEEIAKKLNKTTFAIQMKRGPFLMELQEWAIRHEKHKITEEDIKEFLGENK